MPDYKDTAFGASQMLATIASFMNQNRGAVENMGVTLQEVRDMGQRLMDDVRSLYK